MNETNKTYRIRTDLGINTSINVKLDQDYNAFEILSLQLNQEDMYRLQTVNYGVIVGRVLANGGFGVPNAKISVFIESEMEDRMNVIIAQLYPYTSTRSTNNNGIRYNLLPSENASKCHRAVGTFPSKTYVLDNDDVIEVFDKYYRYTTRTNNSGDFIICGVPVGNQTVHMDLDLSDCGILSQKPRDFYYKGYNVEQFENPNQFKTSEALDSLSQIFTQDQVVNVIPFWGNKDQGETVGITRCDIDVNYKFEPTCVFMGSVVCDNSSNGISKRCIATNSMGDMDELITGEGTVEMIRKTIDGRVEEFQIKGTELINGDGVWCYQIPMNLDYMVTDEYGNMVPTDNPNKGIPTRTSVRFRISMHDMEENTDNYFLSKVLVPNNPKNKTELDYNFGSMTKDTSFRDMYWNNVYSIKSYIPRFQRSMLTSSERFTGIKHCNIHGNNNPMPYNNIRIKLPLTFTMLCILVKTYIAVVGMINNIIAFITRTFFMMSTWKVFTCERRSALYNKAQAMTLVVLRGGLCPDLEGWYFAPATAKLTEKKKDKCRKWWDILGLAIEQDTKAYNLLASTLKMIKDAEIRDYVGGYGDENGKGTSDDVVSNTTTSFNDETSIDYQNSQDSEETICLTTDINYLVSCIEMNLAQEKKVINFDFYNDWLNGVIYLPRWMKHVKKKRKYLWGLIEVPTKIKGCLTSSGGGNGSISFGTGGFLGISFARTRKYTQQCALSYDLYASSTPKIATDKGCFPGNGLFNLQRCHKAGGFKQAEIFGENGGVIQERKTSRGQYVYYTKPCEWHNNGTSNVKVNLFACDLILLGSLEDCNQQGIPQAFKHLTNTSYVMPTNLALTNMDSDSAMFGQPDGTMCSGKRAESSDAGSRDLSNPTYKVRMLTGVTDMTFAATEKFYSTNENEIVNYTPLDDYVTLTEAAGIAWNYTGPGQGEPGFNRTKFYQPGGHFLGVSCLFSQTNIKSCVNLERACEAGASISQRREVVKGVKHNNTTDETTLLFNYYVPTGFIGKDDIVDEDFRTMFASMNHRRLIGTRYDLQTGYPVYDFYYLRPNAFDGSIKDQISGKEYNMSMSDYVIDENHAEVIPGLEYDADIAQNTYTRTVEAQNRDYYFYRLGINSFSDQYSKYFVKTNGKYSMPQYENSFYFYFGLHPGATALDELFKQYFANCEAETIDESGYVYKYIAESALTEEELMTVLTYTSVPLYPTDEYPTYIKVGAVYYRLAPIEELIEKLPLTLNGSSTYRVGSGMSNVSFTVVLDSMPEDGVVRYNVNPPSDDLDNQFLSVTMSTNSETSYSFAVSIMPNHNYINRTGKITVWVESENITSDMVTVNIVQEGEEKPFDPTFDGWDNDTEDHYNYDDDE